MWKELGALIGILGTIFTISILQGRKMDHKMSKDVCEAIRGNIEKRVDAIDKKVGDIYTKLDEQIVLLTELNTKVGFISERIKSG